MTSQKNAVLTSAEAIPDSSAPLLDPNIEHASASSMPMTDTTSISNGNINKLDISFSQAHDEEDIEQTKTGIYSSLVVSCAAVAGFMFGYDTACISSILVFLDKSKLVLTPYQKEIVTGITSVGSFFGSIGAALLADKYGRKLIITICCIVFTSAAIELASSSSFPALLIGRFVVGLAVGAASMIVPVYISEIAPSKKRGRLLTLNSISTTGGQLIANVIAFGIRSVQNNWRWMFLISGLPPLLFLIFMGLIPESPRFLILNNRTAECKTSLSKLYPNASELQIDKKVELIELSVISSLPGNSRTSLTERLLGSKETVRALAVGCGLMFYQQAVGFNSFMYYGATIFATVGVADPIFVSILISGTNFLFTFVAFRYIDRAGRRKMLLSTVWIMSLGLFLASFAFVKTGTINRDSVSNNLTISTRGDVDRYAILLLVSIMVYVASYASALGTVPWSSVEFLPTEARAPGAAMISCTNWLTNSVISTTYLSMLSALEPSGTCIVFGIVCLLAWGSIFKWYPEVNGLSLEEIRDVFKDGIDVHYASRISQTRHNSQI